MNPINYLDQAKEKPDQRIIPNEDFSKIFIDPHDKQNRDPGRPLDQSASNSNIAPDDFGFITALSPLMRYSPFSPTRGSGLSFYETFTRRFENKNNPIADESAKANRLDFRSFSRINSNNSDFGYQQPDKNVPATILNYLNASNASFKEIINERSSLLNDSSSPLRLELWKVDSAAQSSPKSPQNEFLPPKQDSNFAIGLHSIKNLQDVAKPEPEIVKFKNLCLTLESLFVQNKVSCAMIQKLTSMDEDVINLLLQRKFAKRLTDDEMKQTAEKKASLINDIINSKSQKRPEECYKFILTRVIKYLKRRLKDFPDCPADVEAYLYELYFKDTANKLGFPITDFHYPLTGQRGKFKLNSVYFDKIFKSEKFLEGVGDYINNILYNEYKSEIMKKIESLLVRWDQQLQDSTTNIPELEKNIKEYLLRNKRCKLPWTMKEVTESIERFVTLIKNYRSK